MLVILTRTPEENRRTAAIFKARGLAVCSVPMIEARPLPPDQCGMRSIRRIAGDAPVIITSAYAADLWLDLRETGEVAAPSAYYVVGQRSAALLADGDPDVPIRAVAGSAEDLCRGDFTDVRRALYPCSAERRGELVAGLRGRGIEVIEAPLYQLALPPNAEACLRSAIALSPSFITFFSPSAVRNAFRLKADFPENLRFAAVGRTTASELRGYGIGEIIVPDHPSAGLLAEAIARGGQ